ASLEHLHQQLEEMTDQNGESFAIVSLPMPRPIHFKDQRLPASYANFYIANNVVIVPQFDDPADDHAANIIGEQFPGREIVGIRAVDLVWGLGAFHCITQQQPA
ncbi:MAG: agmatine deiminase family protein, partial [Pirellulales bacterium]|nr:agmatine deiminase family protein [Pirellulales bacterium]